MESSGTFLRVDERSISPRLPVERFAPVVARPHGDPDHLAKDKLLVRKITNSTAFRSYQHAFSDATGLPLSLQAIDDFAIAHVGDRYQSPFCALLVTHNSTCAETMRFQSALQEKATGAPATICSRYGVNQTAVPVKLGDRLIGHLHTGQVFFHRPTTVQARNAFRELRKSGIRVSSRGFLRAYKGTPVFERRVYDGIICLLEFFASQIASMANHVLLQETETVPAHIMRARQFIAEHYDEELRLSNLARYLGVSPFVLCKQFRRSTGVTFKDYVSRLRVEKAKTLLLNPKYRISEAAYSAGFRSLSNFNRHFGRITGQSPTQYRRRLKQLNAVR